MLTRTKSVSDGRRVLVSITDEGRQLQNAAAGQFRQYIREIFGKMAAGDRNALISGLESFVRAAETVSRDGDGVLPAARSSPRSRQP